MTATYSIKEQTSELPRVLLCMEFKARWKKHPEERSINTEYEYLAFLRRNREEPIIGWWFPTGNDQCCFCGAVDQYFVMDHCHVSGWKRGTLCASCNTAESRNSGTDSPQERAWNMWRHTAPLLSDRIPYGSGILPQRTLMSMTLEDIFKFNDHMQDIIQRKSCEEAERIFGGY